MTQASTAPGFWQRTHHLGRMGLRDSMAAYFTHYAVIVYLALAAVSIVFLPKFDLNLGVQSRHLVDRVDDQPVWF